MIKEISNVGDFINEMIVSLMLKQKLVKMSPIQEQSQIISNNFIILKAQFQKFQLS